jgi:hypothetical protein
MPQATGYSAWFRNRIEAKQVIPICQDGNTDIKRFI